MKISALVSPSVATESVLTLKSRIDEDKYKDISSPSTSKSTTKVDIIDGMYSSKLVELYLSLDISIK